MATPKRPPRTGIVQIRLTEADKKRWQAAADADKRTLSDWLRVQANLAAGGR